MFPTHNQLEALAAFQTSHGRSTVEDRRAVDRLPFPGELLVVWSCELEYARAQRYAMVDASHSGFRIRAEKELPVGMTGMVLRLLPDQGKSLEYAVQIA